MPKQLTPADLVQKVAPSPPIPTINGKPVTYVRPSKPPPKKPATKP